MDERERQVEVDASGTDPEPCRPTEGCVDPAAAGAVNALGHRLLTHSREGNVAFSPASISWAMALAYAGASGRTASEIAEELRYPDDKPVVSLGVLTGALQRRSRRLSGATDIEVGMFEEFWLQAGLEVGQPYLDMRTQFFHPAPRRANFRGTPEEARSRLNRPVAKLTHGRIPEVVPASAVSRGMQLVLVHALYLRAPWEMPFPEQRTRNAAFETPEGSRQVPTMRLTHEFRMARGAHFRALELPYAGGDLAALVILPDEGERRTVEQTLDAETFAATVDALGETDVEVQLPRFEIRQRLDVRERLRKLGVRRVFEPSAELDVIHPDVSVDAARTEAVARIDEQGLEAGTAAAAENTDVSAADVDFIVDRPFLFYVYDRSTGTQLVVARVSAPSE